MTGPALCPSVLTRHIPSPPRALRRRVPSPTSHAAAWEHMCPSHARELPYPTARSRPGYVPMLRTWQDPACEGHVRVSRRREEDQEEAFFQTLTRGAYPKGKSDHYHEKALAWIWRCCVAKQFPDRSTVDLRSTSRAALW